MYKVVCRFSFLHCELLLPYRTFGSNLLQNTKAKTLHSYLFFSLATFIVSARLNPTSLEISLYCRILFAMISFLSSNITTKLPHNSQNSSKSKPSSLKKHSLAMILTKTYDITI